MVQLQRRKKKEKYCKNKEHTVQLQRRKKNTVKIRNIRYNYKEERKIL